MSTFLFIASLSALLVISCSSNPSEPGTGSTIAPKTGSSFQLSGYSLDSNNTPMAGGSGTVTCTLSDIRNGIAGRNNVYFYTFDGQDDAAYIYTYRENGDVGQLYYVPTVVGTTVELDSLWLDFPVDRNESVDTVLYQEIQNLGIASIETSIDFRAERVGDTTMTIDGNVLEGITINAELTNRQRTSVIGQGNEEYLVRTVYAMVYVPSIGFLARQQIYGYNIDGSYLGASVIELESYQLK